MDKDISQVGQYLRYEREKTNVTVEEIASKLKLSVATVKALEEGTYKDLPETVYVKGYIRAYCLLIGIDSAPAMKLFTDQVETNDPVQETQSFSPIVNEHAQYLTRVWGTVLVLAIIVFILISGWNDQETTLRETHRTPDTPSTNLPYQTDTNEVSDVKQVIVAPQEEVLQLRDEPQPEQQLGDKEVLLTLTAQAPSWARVYTQENEIIRRILPAGYRKEFVVKLPVNIELGDARNVEVFFNEEKYNLNPHISNLNTAFFIIEKLPTSQ